mgnify:FL=1
MMMFDDTKCLKSKTTEKCTAVFNIHFHLPVA